MSKVINAGLTLLAFSRVLTHLFTAQPFEEKVRVIIKEAMFGLTEGAFDLQAGAQMYGPVGAAAALGFIRSYVTKHFPVRR